MEKRKKINIALIGHSFCSRNLGVGALAFGVIYAIEEACKRELVDYEVTCFETSINAPFINVNSKIKLEEFNLKNIL